MSYYIIYVALGKLPAPKRSALPSNSSDIVQDLRVTLGDGNPDRFSIFARGKTYPDINDISMIDPINYIPKKTPFVLFKILEQELICHG